MRELFDPLSTEPFRVSRLSIDLFLQCPRCFYLDLRLGVKRVRMFPFTLNNAVDELLKREFDIARAKGVPAQIMLDHKINAVPFNDPRMDEWRDAYRRGMRYLHPATNLLVQGGVDDLWINLIRCLHVVDYKATSTEKKISLDDPWKIGYKRQVEVYQWIFRHLGFQVDPVAFFVYCNADKKKPAFDGKLEFETKIIPYHGDDSWVEGTLIAIKECLMSDTLPASGKKCDWCDYRRAAARHEKEVV